MPLNEVGSNQDFREHDSNVAHVVAEALNRLIDEGVLNREDVSKASEEKFEEFLSRYGRSVKYGEFTEVEKLKVKTLFSREVPSDEYVNPEETAAEMRVVLHALQAEDAGVWGFILFGSRMDKTKVPRNKVSASDEVQLRDEHAGLSDLDVIVVCDFREFRFRSDLKTSVGLLRDTLFPTSTYMPVSVAEAMSARTLLKSFAADADAKIDEVPYWSWNANSIKFIGALTDDGRTYNEAEVNEMLQRYLRSPRLIEAKEREINYIREILLQPRAE